MEGGGASLPNGTGIIYLYMKTINFLPNVGKYGIHGAFGLGFLCVSFSYTLYIFITWLI